MFVVFDIETERLVNPEKIWVIIAKDTQSKQVYKFLNVHDDPEPFKRFAQGVTCWIGHNVLGFDVPQVNRILGHTIDNTNVIDTLVISRLLNSSLVGGHSLESWGERLGSPKIHFSAFHCLSKEMIDYCEQDVEVTLKLYLKFKPYIDSPVWKKAMRVEHDLAVICKEMSDQGFFFDIAGAKTLHTTIVSELDELLKEIQAAFPPRSKLIREITPKATQHGTIHRGDFRWLADGDLTSYQVGSTFSLVDFEPFNPGSPKQVVERLNEAGWKPFEKTKGHLQAERDRDKERLDHFRTYGWKVSENNLATLPSIEKLEDWVEHCRIKIPNRDVIINEFITKKIVNVNEPTPEIIIIETKNIIGTNSLNVSMDLVRKTLIECHVSSITAAEFVAKTHHLWSIIVTAQDVYVDCSAITATPIWAGLKNIASQHNAISTNRAAKKLVRWLLLDSRRSTLEEWFKAYNEHTGRIHGSFHGIGAWTHRMSHSAPNMANIPAGDTPYAHEMRSMWTVPKDRFLVGVDADGIQLRILAHYMQDRAFTEALINGDKDKGTDAHSMNRRALGENICSSRDDAKTFIYAWLLGAGTGKVAQILGCTFEEAKIATTSFLEFYPGLEDVKRRQIPYDAQRGYFEGLDGRLVMCDNEHLMLAGYLQNGETVVMRHANVWWREKLRKEKVPFWQVNFVHDEWQTETIRDLDVATYIAETQAESIRIVGEQLGVRCPLAGSIKNSHKKLAIGDNWSYTH